MKHTITVQFKTDSRLTEKQMDNLISMIALQLDEPQDLDGNDEEWRAGDISFHWTATLGDSLQERRASNDTNKERKRFITLCLDK
jgi:hypothetical protein